MLGKRIHEESFSKIVVKMVNNEVKSLVVSTNDSICSSISQRKFFFRVFSAESHPNLRSSELRRFCETAQI